MNRTLKAIAAIMLMMVFAVGCNKPDEPNNESNELHVVELPVVITEQVGTVTQRLALCRGRIIDEDTFEINEKGVCWSTSHNPQYNENHISFSSGHHDNDEIIWEARIVDLYPNTVYYVKAYAVTSDGISYGEEVSFTTGINKNWPNGVLPGVFSVGENESVRFSQGNLQYQASTNTWRFAENQIDFVGNGVLNGNVFEKGEWCANQCVSQSYCGWIDLFSWGTSGYNHGASNYQPWSYGGSNEDYYAYGNMYDNLYDGDGRADWGYNAIVNGGNVENEWRTLTYNEWRYITHLRETPSNIRYAMAKVNGVNGLILLPDDWSGNYYSLNSINPSQPSSYNDNIISASQWISLEQHGAVFLPAAGIRVEGWPSGFETGHYWMSSFVFEFRFEKYGGVGGVYSTEPYFGHSVRLVCENN